MQNRRGNTNGIDSITKMMVLLATVPATGQYMRFRYMRTMVTLACTECKRRNYTTTKNKANMPDRMEIKKYCPWCKKHTLHKETR